MSTFQGSLLNEIIGPVMRGPSSSHTAAPHAIGRAVRALALGEDRTMVDARVRFDPGGSFAAVHRAQGSDRGFAAGLLGLAIDDAAEADALETARRDVMFRVEIAPLARPDHPNAVEVVIRSTGAGGDVREDVVEAVSTGGGSFVVRSLDGHPLGWNGDAPLTVVVDGVSRSAPAARLPVVGTPPFALTPAAASGVGEGLVDACLTYEAAMLGISPVAVRDLFAGRLDVMLGSVQRGLAQAADMWFLRPSAARLAVTRPVLVSGAQWAATAAAVAVMEHDVGGGVVVAAPTAGSAGILPGVLHALTVEGFDRGRVIDVLCAAAVVGGVFAAHGTFAAECAGCAVETGAAAAMAAAGLVTAHGGDAATAFEAAALVLLNTAGLVCDPVAGEVEIPCHARNVAGVAHAFSAAAAALGGFRAGLPFDELARAVVQVGQALPSSLRCTAEGGCAVTPTAVRLVAAGRTGRTAAGGLPGTS